MCLVAAPSGEDDRCSHMGWGSGRLSYQACLVGQQRGRGQFASEDVAPCQQAEREIHVHECARLASGLQLTRGEYMPGLVVPQFKGYSDSVSKPRERKPSTDLLIGGLRREKTFKSPSERTRGGRVSVGQAD